MIERVGLNLHGTDNYAEWKRLRIFLCLLVGFSAEIT